MAPIVASTEIARSPEDVFRYVTDPSHIHEWQESAVSAKPEQDGPLGEGSRVAVTRRVGRMERTMTVEMTERTPPSSWTIRGVDGPVRVFVKGTIEPIDDGSRSRITVEIEPEGHGLGKLLVPLVVNRKIQKEHPQNLANLKARLESGAGGDTGAPDS
jgi:uncharacterized protein YndB with AHSA1/START domain